MGRHCLRHSLYLRRPKHLVFFPWAFLLTIGLLISLISMESRRGRRGTLRDVGWLAVGAAVFLYVAAGIFWLLENSTIAGRVIMALALTAGLAMWLIRHK